MSFTKTTLSASTLSGDEVKNAAGEDLGHIKDIVLDTTSGQIAYYVLSFGGFLGLGDKLFAVPPQSIQIDTEEECIVLNVTKEQLKDAPGFDKDNWPDFADQRFRDQIYSYYGYEYRKAA